MTTTTEYNIRYVAVFSKGAKACWEKGPNWSRCILVPDHGGNHEGPGSDRWGPMYRCWSAKEEVAQVLAALDETRDRIIEHLVDDFT